MKIEKKKKKKKNVKNREKKETFFDGEIALVPLSTQFTTMCVFRIVWCMHFQMRFQILWRLIFNAADATFEIFTILMRAHMPINQKARRKIFPTDLATEKNRKKIRLEVE